MSDPRMCHDCGKSGIHPDDGSKCRPCAERSGHSYAFHTDIDHDKLRLLLGEKWTLQIIDECRYGC